MATYNCVGKTGDRYEKYKESYTAYRHEHREELKKLKDLKYQVYQLARREWIEENRDKWLHYKKKHNHKRRGLGFFQLNDFFPNSVGHHINRETVIFIPIKLHKTISHNVFTGENMDKINKLAIDFLEKK